jgi:hypothetical protein
MSVSELEPAPYNPRQLTEKQAKDLDRSLDRFNLADPIIINTNKRIIGGHQRINILKQRGVTEVDVRIPSRPLTEHEEKELNLRLNKNLGEWDYDLLASFDEDMLLDVGFDSKELDNIFQLEPDEKDDEVPDTPDDPETKRGDLYQLGKHRLLCGDSTKVEDVERLMDGKKADLIVTDPPYGVNYQAKDSQNRKISGDESLESSKDIWSKVFRNYHKFSKDGASYYSFSCQGGDQMMMMMMIGENWQVKHELMWLKNNFVFGRCDYKYQHEPIIYGWKQGKTHQFYGDAKQSSVQIRI